MVDERQKRNFKGAHVPSGSQWQMQKTAASIKFVYDAEQFLPGCEDAESVTLLKDGIEKIKSGKLVLSTWTTPQDYIETQRNKV